MAGAWREDLLAFWFSELRPAQWFEKSSAIDDAIRLRFGAVYERIAANPPVSSELSDSPDALAHLILLDQLPRNMFRGTARMFASDAAALSIAHTAVERKLDQQSETSRRLFFYLPFEHSEAAGDQDLSVAFFERLGDADYLRYAIAHRDIIRRFGRFPHRNALLGRVSTPEEAAFLTQPGSSF